MDGLEVWGMDSLEMAFQIERASDTQELYALITNTTAQMGFNLFFLGSSGVAPFSCERPTYSQATQLLG